MKASTEFHLFLVMMLVLASKSKLEHEAFGVEPFDMVAVVTFVIFVPVCTILAVMQKWKVMAMHDKMASNLNTHTDRIKEAFQRHCAGRNEAADNALLREYIESLESEVNADYHVFISCKQASPVLSPDNIVALPAVCSVD